MPFGITHGFQSGKSDGSDATQVQPSHWNAGHTIEGTFTETTPTPVPTGSGSFTSASATVRYVLLGKIVIFRITGSITTVGTATGGMRIPLPFTMANTTWAFGADNATGVTGAAGAQLYSTSCDIFLISGGTSLTNGKSYIVNGTGEIV